MCHPDGVQLYVDLFIYKYVNLSSYYHETIAQIPHMEVIAPYEDVLSILMSSKAAWQQAIACI